MVSSEQLAGLERAAHLLTVVAADVVRQIEAVEAVAPVGPAEMCGRVVVGLTGHAFRRTATIRRPGDFGMVVRHFVSNRQITNETIIARLNAEGISERTYFIDIIDTPESAEVL